MEQIKIIPTEILNIVPKYDGKEKLLNLFLSKCEYVLKLFQIEGNSEQNLYVFHSLSSKLTDRAASLLNDHHSITSWQELKELLHQHFGDHRSEECIALELENLKLKQGESFIQFYHRIQNVKSSLFAKLKKVTDEELKASRFIFYNDIALNVFLFNLPEEIIHKVRLKSCPNLESALSIATEEASFLEQYKARNSSFGYRPDFMQPSIVRNGGGLYGGQVQSNMGHGHFGQGVQPFGSTFPQRSTTRNITFHSQNQRGATLFGTQSLKQQQVTVCPQSSGNSILSMQSEIPPQNSNQGQTQSFGSMPQGGITFGSDNQQDSQFGTQNQQHVLPKEEQEDSKSLSPNNNNV